MLKNMFGTRITKQHNTDYPIHFTFAKSGKFNLNKFQHI